MRLLRLQSVICLGFTTTIVLTPNVPDSSEEAVTNAGSSKRQGRAVADQILPAFAAVFGVSLLQNTWRIAAENYSPGLCHTSFQYTH